MKFLIINNKNKESLNKLIESLNLNIKGEWTFDIFDASGKLEQSEYPNISKKKNLKEWILEKLSDEKDGLYTIIDENKLLIEGFDTQDVVEIMSDQEIFCFSLALGKNITYCANMNCDNIFKPLSEGEKALVWDWSLHYFDFGYPLNLDGTVFRGKELQKFIKSIHFENSLELENALQIFDNYPKNLMSSFKKGKIVEIVFEKPELWSSFDKEKLEGNRIKYQILEKNEVIDKISDKI